MPHGGWGTNILGGQVKKGDDIWDGASTLAGTLFSDFLIFQEGIQLWVLSESK